MRQMQISSITVTVNVNVWHLFFCYSRTDCNRKLWKFSFSATGSRIEFQDSWLQMVARVLNYKLGFSRDTARQSGGEWIWSPSRTNWDNYCEMGKVIIRWFRRWANPASQANCGVFPRSFVIAFPKLWPTFPQIIKRRNRSCVNILIKISSFNLEVVAVLFSSRPNPLIGMRREIILVCYFPVLRR